MAEDEIKIEAKGSRVSDDGDLLFSMQLCRSWLGSRVA